MKKTCIILWLLCLQTSHLQAAEEPKKRVCVIGAGPAGLASVKQLAAHSNEFEPMVFEKNSDVGGTWIYTDNKEVDKYGFPVHSSIYKNLRTNVPKELMAFPNYQEFYGEEQSCVRHETVLQYLKNFTDHFNLRQFIQFDTVVKEVSPILNGKDDDWQRTKWRLEAFDLRRRKTNETICDAVMVCNGHFFEPLIPKIPGIDTFSGKLLHSHAYRKPNEFARQTVALLGASFSGVDIAIDLSNHAKKIYLSHRHMRIKSEMPANVEQVRGIVAASGKVLLLRNNATITVDALIYCTGYKYSMPFLEPSSHIMVADKSVFPLYKHLVNIKHPTMGFIGIPDTTVFLPTFYAQARYFVAFLQGKTKLPDPANLLHDALNNVMRKRRRPHLLDGNRQWDYLDDLARDGQFEPIPDLYRNGYVYWVTRLIGKQLTFRNYDLRISDDGRFDLLGPKDRRAKDK